LYLSAVTVQGTASSLRKKWRQWYTSSDTASCSGKEGSCCHKHAATESFFSGYVSSFNCTVFYI